MWSKTKETVEFKTLSETILFFLSENKQTQKHYLKFSFCFQSLVFAFNKNHTFKQMLNLFFKEFYFEGIMCFRLTTIKATLLLEWEYQHSEEDFL